MGGPDPEPASSAEKGSNTASEHPGPRLVPRESAAEPPCGPFAVRPARPLFRAWLGGLHAHVSLSQLARLADLPYSMLLDEARHHYDTLGGAPVIEGRRCKRCRQWREPHQLEVGSYDRWGRALPGLVCIECRRSFQANALKRRKASTAHRRPIAGPKKTCTVCGETKSALRDFGTLRSNPDGLNNRCKTCSNERIRRHYEANRERGFLLTDNSPKTCTRCGQHKLGADFNFDANRKDGRSVWCRECNNAQRRNAYRLRQQAKEQR